MNNGNNIFLTRVKVMNFQKRGALVMNIKSSKKFLEYTKYSTENQNIKVNLIDRELYYH